jgi:hypothetical protein
MIPVISCKYIPLVAIHYLYLDSFMRYSVTFWQVFLEDIIKIWDLGVYEMIY